MMRKERYGLKPYRSFASELRIETGSLCYRMMQINPPLPSLMIRVNVS